MRQLVSFIILFFTLVSFNCKKKEKTLALNGIINFLNGDVKLILLDDSARNAKVGDEIRQDMKIQTIGDKSFADIYFGENAIKILGNTVIEIKKLATNIKSNTEKYEFFLENGSFFSRVKRKLERGDVFRVSTPTTTASVRGTEFLVSEDKGKANVACLSGLVSVVNNTMPEAETAKLREREEVDVAQGKDMVTKKISGDRLKIFNILLEIKAMKEDIRTKFEKQREEIRKHVIDQRDKVKAEVEEQKEKARALVADQKKIDHEKIDGIKGEIKDARKSVVGTVRDKMKEAKGFGKDSPKKEAEKLKEAVKPKIEKFKINKDSLKE